MRIGSYNKILEITISKRENQQATNYWDANWLNALMVLYLNENKFAKEINIHIDEINVLKDKLDKLLENRIQNIYFENMEEDFKLNITDGLEKGYTITIDFQAQNVSFETNLSDMKDFTKSIDNILKDYPVIIK